MEAFFAAFLVLGGFWFWALVILANLILFTAIEYRQGFVATVSVLVTLGLLQWMGNIRVFSWIWENPALTVLYAISFFAIGTVWSVVKWWFYSRKQRRIYNEKRHVFCLKYHLDESESIPAIRHEDWKKCIMFMEVPPQVNNHKEEVYLWITYWPWSMLWTVINDPITRLIRFIYNNISGLLHRISLSAFRGTEGDLRA